MDKIITKHNILFLMIILFFINGIMYFVFPEQIGNAFFIGKYFKYIVFLTFFFLDCSISINKLKFVLGSFIALIISWFLAGHCSIMALLNYLFPMLTILIPLGKMEKNINLNKIFWYVYVVVSAMSYIEYFCFFGLFYQFADKGYRVCSILINPNNLAYFICLTTVFLLFQKQNYFVKGILLLNNTCIVVLSGSRSGLAVLVFLVLLFAVFDLFRGLKYHSFSKKYYLLGGIIIIFFIPILHSFFEIIHLLGLREIDTISFYIGRYEQWSGFLKLIKLNPVFPYTVDYQYVDSCYLHIYGTFGLLVLIIFLLFNIIFFLKLLNKREYMACFFFLVYSIIGIFDNIIYVWPCGYIYWGLVSHYYKILKTNS